MPKKPKRLHPSVIAADRATIRAIEKMGDAYRPTDPAYSIERLKQLEADLTQAELAEARAQLAYDRARAAHEEALRVVDALRKAAQSEG